MKKLWTTVIVVAVVVGAVWMLNGGSDKLGTPDVSSSPSAVVKVTATPKAGSVKATPTPTATATPVPTAAQSYTQLVTQYKDKRIQFDQECRANPTSLTFKNGDSILLDNRANHASAISVNGRTYNLVAYGYQIVTLSSSSLPKALGVTCNNMVNTSTINLQANISGE